MPLLEKNLIRSVQKSQSSILSAIGYIVALIFFIPITLIAQNTKAHASSTITPALGVDATSIYGCDINEQKISNLANSLISTTLQDSGYSYISIRDCWQKRDDYGHLIADPDKFPHGIDNLIKDIHSKRLKLGLSIDLTSTSCGGAPGSAGHFDQDAAAITSLNVDEINISACDNNFITQLTHLCTADQGAELFLKPFTAFRSAVAATHHFTRINSLLPAIAAQHCGYGSSIYAHTLDFSSRLAQSWSYSLDNSLASWDNAVNNYTNALELTQYQHTGGYGNAGILDIGRTQLTAQEEQFELATWALLGSPLILGIDPQLLNSSQIALLKNNQMLAVEQNTLVNGPVYQIYRDNTINILLRQLSDTTYAGAVITLARETFFYSVPPLVWGLPDEKWKKTDIFTGDSIPFMQEVRDYEPTHGVRFFILHHDPTTPSMIPSPEITNSVPNTTVIASRSTISASSHVRAS